MKIILAILGAILMIPIVIAAAAFILGAGAGLIIRMYSIEFLVIAGVIMAFLLVKKIFK